MTRLTLANFNTHAGIDGWGRPFDVVGACRELQADVLVLQEVWAPSGQALAADVADALGYEAHTFTMARAVLHPPFPEGHGGASWGPPRYRRRGVGLRLDVHRRPAPETAPAPDRVPARVAGLRAGTVGLAVLSRLPVRHSQLVELGRMLGDQARRAALVVDLEVAGHRLVVAGTHMPHLSKGSLVQFRRLHRALATSGTDMVLLGDMNLFGPPLEVLFRGWRRAVRGRTWPAWRPLAQIDHVLVTPGLTVVDAAVKNVGRSDHLAVRVTVNLP